jgi:DNA polymerase III alpha subunit
MGFYHPATIVSDAQRHGLKVLPVDVTKSEWLCTLEPSKHSALSSQHSEHSNSESKFENSNISDTVIPSEGFPPESRDLVFFASNKLPPQGLKPPLMFPTGGTAEAVPSQPPFREISCDDQHPVHSLRLGLRYVRGLREEAGQVIARERNKASFLSIHDLIRRVPELRKDELDTLAEIGALNSIGKGHARSPSASSGQAFDSRSPLTGDEGVARAMKV